GWLFPSMLVLGGIIAYATRNNGGEGMFGNLLWLIVAGTALIFTSMNAVTIVNSVEGVRTAGSDMVATMSTGATGTGETPIAYATRNNGGEGMFGNLLWLIVAGTALIFTSMNAVTIVNSVEGVRTAGSDMVATMSTGATVNGETPIAYANPEDEALEGNASD